MPDKIPQIVQKKWLWFSLSAILIIPGIIVLFTSGIKVGIDFKGGAEITYVTNKPVTVNGVENLLKPLGLKDETIQLSGNKEYIVHTDTINQSQHDQIKNILTKAYGGSTETSYTEVGPSVSSDQTTKAIESVIAASIAIILYIAWAFRKVPKPASSWRFGFSAIAALGHDLLFVVGMFAILGKFLSYVQVDSLFVTALLTVMGFSVHDTIVVFDRIRENLRLNPGGDFEETANVSVVQTLARSLNTSLTVLLVLLTLFLLGGESTKGFVLALLLGITVGTYSSIFNATPILVLWEKHSRLKKVR